MEGHYAFAPLESHAGVGGGECGYMLSQYLQGIAD